MPFQFDIDPYIKAVTDKHAYTNVLYLAISEIKEAVAAKLL